MTDPLSAAQALRTTINAARHETESARCLPTSVVDGLIRAGLCRLTVPESLGGREAEPLIAFDVYEELASAEPSVAWIAWNNALLGLLTGISRMLSEPNSSPIVVGSSPARRVRQGER
ncbi:MAG: acyl-CoA dehydrogenase family protein [Candidatus Binatia bacterium]